VGLLEEDVTSTAFFGRAPIAWIGFSALILLVPFVGFLVERGRFVEALPTINASLNALSATLLVLGWRAIRARKVSTHWQLMLSATATSVAFLVFYVIRFSLTGVHRYPVDDWTKTVYLTVLTSHTLLAAMVPFLVGAAIYLAARKRFDRHRRIARLTFPVWLYVSVTGVVVYLMLYHLHGHSL
jgi:putative membrane protein